MTPDTWCVVVVRAWLEGDRVTVRLMESGSAGDRTIVVTSIDAASRELARVLASIAIRPVEDAQEDPPGTRP